LLSAPDAADVRSVLICCKCTFVQLQFSPSFLPSVCHMSAQTLN